jgi:hypothetical protein
VKFFFMAKNNENSWGAPRITDQIRPSLKLALAGALGLLVLDLGERVGGLLMDRAAEFPELNDFALTKVVGLDPKAKDLCENGKNQTTDSLKASRESTDNWAHGERVQTFNNLGLVDQSKHFCRGEGPEYLTQNEITSDTAFAKDRFAFTWHLTGAVPVDGGLYMRADFKANPYPTFLRIAPYTHSEIFLPVSDSIASTPDPSGGNSPLTTASR